jgi:hypothetical protein
MVIAHRLHVYISLATETEPVRSRLAAYGNDLLSLGADGFRFDAAKRECLLLPSIIELDIAADIAATDLANITSRFDRKPAYATCETIFGGAVQPEEYVNICTPCTIRAFLSDEFA